MQNLKFLIIIKNNMIIWKMCYQANLNLNYNFETIPKLLISRKVNCHIQLIMTPEPSLTWVHKIIWIKVRWCFLWGTLKLFTSVKNISSFDLGRVRMRFYVFERYNQYAIYFVILIQINLSNFFMMSEG